MSPSVDLSGYGSRFRMMRLDEISLDLKRAAAEGPNPGLADHAGFAVDRCLR